MLICLLGMCVYSLMDLIVVWALLYICLEVTFNIMRLCEFILTTSALCALLMVLSV